MSTEEFLFNIHGKCVRLGACVVFLLQARGGGGGGGVTGVESLTDKSRTLPPTREIMFEEINLSLNCTFCGCVAGYSDHS